jgi:DNA-binding protein HU-beta
MAKAAKPAAAKTPAASAKGDKVPAPSKAKVPAKGAAAAANGATAAAVSLKQMAAGLAESHDLPKRQVEAMLGAFVQSLAEHLQQGTKGHPFQGLLAWARTRAVATWARATAAST